MTLVTLNNISKRFEETTAVSDVSLNVERGEFFGLLGPSGCGKTTTLRMIAGLETPDSGTIHFEGRDITRLSPDKRGFGMVFQNYALFPHLNVFENVAFGLRARKKPKTEITKSVSSALELVQLPGYEKRRVDELSGGQQQRVAIARALAVEPKVLMFDEPTSALDPEMVNEVLDVMRELAHSGTTMLVVTHEMAFAREAADRIVFMVEGEIICDLPPRQFFERQDEPRLRSFLAKIM